MKIAIIGAGAMGSIFGSMLSKVSEVSLIDINQDHVEAIRKNGLKVENMDGSSSTFNLMITNRPEKLSDRVELAIVFTKSCNTRDAAHTARAILDPRGVALTLQNGIGNLEVIQDVLGPDNAIAGVTSHGGTFLGPGNVRHAGIGPTQIANMPSKKILIEKICQIFNAAGIDTSLSDNVNSLIWGKLIINVGINALTAICRVPNGVIGKTSECVDIMKEAVSEAVAVADASGVMLPYDDPVAQVKKVCEATAANRASMLQDILRGARTEIGAINGAIIDRAQALEISTPVNRFLYRVIKAIEATAEYRI
ncbi:MAG: 2-dehydropantoate 2-reductase [Desulfobacterales bacterium]|nr:2-dehydropantoate 2-reductase [Desulfobacterales bacterium]